MEAPAKLVGQPLFSQIIRLIPKCLVPAVVRKNKADRYYKRLPTLHHLIAMMYGVLSKCNSLREVVEGMLTCEGKLNHLGMKKAPPRSTLSDGNNRRSSSVLEGIYYKLMHHYHSFLSDSRSLHGLSFKELLLVDSTTIRLFSNILQGVGRNPKHTSRKKGGLKVHMMMEATEGIARFVRITAAKQHDHTFLKSLQLPPGSMAAFDRAYNDYHRFALWTQNQWFFVSRMKKNAVYRVVETHIDQTATKKQGVIKSETVAVQYKEKGAIKELLLRRVTYIDEKKRQYVFISNNFKISEEEIALIYKYRWGIELLFKKLKRNFPLTYFMGESVNAICIQIWCTLIVQLLLTVLQKKSGTIKAFSTMATVIRLHLMSYVNVMAFLKNTIREWRRQHPPPEVEPQLCLFPPKIR